MLPNCPSREIVADFLHGRLPEAELDSVSGHLEGCGDCQALVETLERASGTMLSQLQSMRAATAQKVPEVCAAALARAELFYDLPAQPAEDNAESASRLGWLRNYELLEKLGQGGMGAVYKARHAKLNRVVALKVLAEKRVQDAQSVARFEAEMKAVGCLEHPNIVRAFDADEVNGVHFLVMEHVAGRDLAHVLKACGQPPAIADACEVVRQAALGLQHAWQNGLVHRDIKPSNLILTPAGVVKVLDLGLAVLQPGVRTGEELTEAAQVLGTVDYIAPEQIRDSHAVDCRADIYSLGCTLFKLLTGRAPFSNGKRKQAMQVIAAHLSELPPDVQSLRPNLPPELVAIVNRMLAKNPDERFATPALVAEALTPFASGAQLAALLQLALLQPTNESSPEVSSTTTFAHVSSSFTDTNTLSPQAVPEMGSAGPAITVAAQTESFGGRGIVRHWKTALAGFGGVVALLAIIILINGNRIEAPEGSEVKIGADGSVSIVPPAAKPFDQPNDQPNPIPSPVSDPSQRTAAISRTALVGHPASLPGVQSWSLETVGPRGPVNAVAYSPNGELVASGGEDGVVRVWNAATGKLVRMLLGHNHGVLGLTFSADSKLLASSGNIGAHDGTVIEWNLATGKLEHEMRTAPFVAFTLSRGPKPHEYWLGGNADFVQLVDLAQRATVRTIETETNTDFMRVSPNGEFIAVASRDVPRGFVIDSTTRKMIATYEGTGIAQVLGVRFAWAPDSNRLAVTDGLGVIDLWNVRENKKLKSFRTKREQPQPAAISWAPQGEVLAFHGHERELWDASSGTKLTDLGPVGGLAAWAPDGTTLVLAGLDSNIYFCDIPSGKLTHTISGHRNNVYAGNNGGPSAWSPDGNSLAIFTNSADDNFAHLRLIDPATGLETGSLKSTDDLSASFDSNTHQLIVSRWPEQQGLLAFYGADLREPARTINLGKMAQRFHAPRFSPNGKWFAIADIEGTVRVFAAEGNKPVYTFTGHKGGDPRMAWSPDSGELATAGHEDWFVRVWSLVDGRLARKFPENDNAGIGHIVNLAWSPDGRTIVTSPVHSGTFYFWDAKKGELLNSAQNPSGGWWGFWPEKSNEFAVFAYGPGCRWINPATGETLRDARGFEPSYAALAPNRRTLASCELNAIYLWDIDTGRRHGAQVWLRNRQSATLSTTGHVRVSHPQVLEQFRYVAQTAAGQETLTAEEFAAKFGWKNDPQQVRLYEGEPASVKPAQHTAPSPALAEPLAPAGMSLVGKPAALPGLRTWTVETERHRGRVWAVAASPDGSLVATGGDDAAIRLWNTTTGELERILTGHDSAVGSLSFSPDNKMLASGSRGFEPARVWNAESGELLGTYVPPGNGGGGAVAFSPEGQRLAISGGGATRIFTVTNATTTQPLATIPRHLGPMAWSPNGEQLAGVWGALGEPEVHVFDSTTGKLLQRFTGHENQVFNVAWSPDGKWLASTSGDSTLRLWNAAEGKPHSVRKVDPGSNTALAWAPDSQSVCIASSGNLERWPLAGEKPLWKQVFGNGEFAVGCLALAWLPQQNQIVTSHDLIGHVRFWNAENGQEVRNVPGHTAPIYGAAFSPADEVAIATVNHGGPNGAVSTYHSQTGNFLTRLQRETKRATRLAWSPAGDLLAVETQDGTVRIRDAKTDEEVGKVETKLTNGWNLTWSPTGKLLAVADERGKIHLWSAAEKKVVRSCENNPHVVNSLAWSPDEKLVAAGTYPASKEIFVWYAATGAKAYTISCEGHGDARAIAFSPDSQRLAVGWGSGEIQAYKLGDAVPYETIPRFDNSYPEWLHWSADGKSLTYTCWSLLFGYDLEQGRLRFRVPAPYEGDYPKVSADGHLVFFKYGHELRGYNLATGERAGAFLVLPGNEAVVIGPTGHLAGSAEAVSKLRYVAVSPAGQTLHTAEEFAAKYGWKNDPSQARLMEPSTP